MTPVRIEPALHVSPIPDHVGRLVEQVLRDGRRHFGSAGASLTHCLPHNGKDSQAAMGVRAVTAGIEGERATSDWLRAWMQDKPDVVLIDSVRVPDEAGGSQPGADENDVPITSDTDHVLIVGDQVMIIDSKRWRPGLYAITSNRSIVRYGKPFNGSNVGALASKRFWMNQLPLARTIHSVVNLVGPSAQEQACEHEEPTQDANSKQRREINVLRDYAWYHAGFTLLDPKRRDEWFTSWYTCNRQGTIVSTLVTQVAVCAIAPYDACAMFDMAAIRQLFTPSS